MAESLDKAAARLAVRLATSIRVAWAVYARHLALVVSANPHGTLTGLLTRYDVAAARATALRESRGATIAAVGKAWSLAGHPGPSGYYQQLVADVERAYAGLPAQLDEAITQAWQSVPDAAPFEPGASAPGANPAMETAHERAAAIRAALAGAASALALRNRLSVDVAGGAALTEAILAQAAERQDAGEAVRLRWVASMDGTDPRTCIWCRRLHGTEVSPGQQFPHPTAAGHRRPPRLYGGHLLGPKLHPNCGCKLVIVPGVALPAPVPAPPPAVEDEEAVFLSSAAIKAMSEREYGALRHFLTSALHELGQVLRRLLRLVK